MENGRRAPAAGKMPPLRPVMRRHIDLIATITKRFRWLPTQAKVLLQMVASRLSTCRETEGILPEAQQCFRPARSAVGRLFVVRRLQELERAREIPQYMCFIDLQKAFVWLRRPRPAVGGARTLLRTREDADHFLPVPRKHARSRADG